MKQRPSNATRRAASSALVRPVLRVKTVAPSQAMGCGVATRRDVVMSDAPSVRNTASLNDRVQCRAGITHAWGPLF